MGPSWLQWLALLLLLPVEPAHWLASRWERRRRLRTVVADAAAPACKDAAVLAAAAAAWQRGGGGVVVGLAVNWHRLTHTAPFVRSFSPSLGRSAGSPTTISVCSGLLDAVERRHRPVIHLRHHHHHPSLYAETCPFSRRLSVPFSASVALRYKSINASVACALSRDSTVRLFGMMDSVWVGVCLLVKVSTVAAAADSWSTMLYNVTGGVIDMNYTMPWWYHSAVIIWSSVL